jgi:hypothetical protein
MKVKVISYSLTGNNDALAARMAAKLSAEHIKISEPKQRTTLTIILDVLFNRVPRISPLIDNVAKNDLVLFVGPVWMGQVATPFRGLFKQLKITLVHYAYISISGGALGPNTKLARELNKRVGKKPAALINLYITDLLPPEPKPTTKVTAAYHVNDEEITRLTQTVMTMLQETGLVAESLTN